MDRDTDIALVRRFFALRASRTDDLAGAPYRNPGSDYTSVEQLERERHMLFRARPVVAGLTADAPAPGDFFTLVCDGVPIVVVRGEDGVARAFVNTCRHRGARVAEGCGRGRRRLVCPYHSWTYGLDGRLTAQPGSGAGFTDLDRTDLGLRPLATAEGHGLIFVRAGGTGSIDLDALLCGLDADLDNYGVDRYQHIETRSQVLSVNWKLVIDTFLEAYHIFSLHKRSIADTYFSSPALFDGFGPNSRYIGVRRSILDLENDPPSDWSILPHATVNYVVAPNTVFVHQIDHLEVWRVFPLGVGESMIHTSLYAPAAPADDRAARYWRKNLDMVLDVTGTEDFPQCERLQADLSAGAVPEMVFGRNEPALIHYHRSLSELLCGDPVISHRG